MRAKHHRGAPALWTGGRLGGRAIRQIWCFACKRLIHGCLQASHWACIVSEISREHAGSCLQSVLKKHAKQLILQGLRDSFKINYNQS